MVLLTLINKVQFDLDSQNNPKAVLIKSKEANYLIEEFML